MKNNKPKKIYPYIVLLIFPIIALLASFVLIKILSYVYYVCDIYTNIAGLYLILFVAPLSIIGFTAALIGAHYVLWKKTHLNNKYVFSILTIFFLGLVTITPLTLSGFWDSSTKMCRPTQTFPYIEQCIPAGDGICIDTTKNPPVKKEVKENPQILSEKIRNSIIETTKEWVQIDYFPVPDSELIIEKSGSMFTREFKISFTAPEKDIRQWLATNPGTATVEPEVYGFTEEYMIIPGGGAQYAKVWYYTKDNKVVIRVYWS